MRLRLCECGSQMQLAHDVIHDVKRDFGGWVLSCPDCGSVTPGFETINALCTWWNVNRGGKYPNTELPPIDEKTGTL
jgi:hypothetical protein